MDLNKDIKTINYLSQAGQDKWVVETLENKEKGYFLDIGAYDGKDISNTYVLENDFGWDGICIDADPINYEKLINTRNVKSINCAVSNENGTVNFVSSGAGGHVSDNGRQVVQSKTLETILKENNCPKVIDYISLDIEGYEHKALEGFPFSEYEFVLMTVEHNLYLGESENKNNIKDILTKNGYIIFKENVENVGDDPFEDWYINPKYVNYK